MNSLPIPQDNIYPQLDLINPCALIDLEGNIIKCNRDFAGLVRQTIPELEQKKHPILFNSFASLQRIDQFPTWDLIKKGNSWEGELTFPDALGFTIWLKTKLIPCRDYYTKEITCLLTVFYDITNSKKLELVHERVVDLLSLGTWDFDLTSQTFVGDCGFEEILGFKSHTPTAVQDFFKQVHPDDAPKVNELIKKSISSGIFDCVYRIKVKDEYRYIHSKGKISEQCGSKPLKLSGFIYDVSEGKNFELEIESQKNIFKSVMDNIPFPVFWKNPKKGFCYEYWNKAAVSIWGVEKSSIIGKNDYDIFPADQANFFRSKDIEAIKSNEIIDIPEESVESVFGTRTFHTKKFTIFNEDGEAGALIGISEDITEKLEHNKQLFHSSQMATIGEMSGGIAHEINNPLTILSFVSEQLRSELEANSSDTTQHLALLNKVDLTIGRIAKIVKGLKTMSREASKDPFELRDVESIIKETLDFCEEGLKREGISLKFTNNALGIKVNCRATEISQVILNLITNAKDALKSLETKWIDISINEHDGNIHLLVTDSGNGIPLKIRDKIMNPFFTTKEFGKGTGLGLSISRQLIENHGGKLQLEDKCPNTCFVIYLPAHNLTSSTDIPS